MLFQTLPFLWLLLAVFAGVILLRTRTLQLSMLLLASWLFYASWEPRFLLLLLYCTVNDYLLGIAIGEARSQRARKAWLVTSLVTNLGVLGVFKYTDFFLASLNGALGWAGVSTAFPMVSLTLPIGISFYTFHSMGYNIDVYRGKTAPERSLLRFAIYVAFFPQLVAGPILRAGQFLPQLARVITLDAAKLRSGAHLFLVGLVKKVAIADNISPIVDHVLNAPQGMPSLAIWIGAIGFTIQIYCDFSGYTDMARGVSRMLGLEIPLNFQFPYFATTITEFWKRWHISLSSWLRDYLYIPLGGNREGAAATYRNLMLTMALGGLWHGASWNFVLWGTYQGALLAIERRLGIGAPPDADASWWRWALRWLLCSYFVVLGWILFRVHSLSDLAYCVRVFVIPDGKLELADLGLGTYNPFVVAGMLGVFGVCHALSCHVGGLANWLDGRGPRLRASVIIAAVVALVLAWPSGTTSFIYFQF